MNYTNIGTFELTTVYALGDPDRTPQQFEFRMVLPTREDAIAFVAQFPRSTGLRATTLSSADGTYGYVTGSARLWADGVNGGRNEAGIKRLRSTLKAANKLGIPVVYRAWWGNSYPDMDEFEAKIGEAVR